MVKNNIELNIGSKFDGEGFQKLNAALKKSSGNVRQVGGAVGNMLSSMDGLDGSAGKLVRTASGLISGFLSMGVWGVAIAGVTKLIGLLSELNQQTKDATLAAKGLSKEYMTVEAAARGYQRRVESWKKAKADKDEKDAKAAEAAKKARDAEIKAIDERTQAEKEYDQYLMKTAALKEKIAGLSNEQIAVNSAQRQLDFANKWGGNYAQTEADLNLQLAQKALASAMEAERKSREEAAKKLADETSAKEKAVADQKAAAEREAKVAKMKEEQAKRVKDIDDKVAALKERAAQLEENAARARGGKTFGEWQRGERQREQDQKKADVRQKNVIKNAEKEIAQLESEQRRFGRGFSKARADRLSKLREFVADQDPKNNPALKEAEALEKQKMDLIAKTQRDIADIAKSVKDTTL